MKTLELNQMENVQGGGCSNSEMISFGAGMLVLAAFSFGTLSIAYGMAMAGACFMKRHEAISIEPATFEPSIDLSI